MYYMTYIIVTIISCALYCVYVSCYDDPFHFPFSVSAFRFLTVAHYAPYEGLTTALMRYCVQGVYGHSPYGSIHSTNEVLCSRGIQALIPLIWGSGDSTNKV